MAGLQLRAPRASVMKICAKRTQFGPAWAGPGPRRAKDAKRTQFPAGPGGTGPAGQGVTVPRPPSRGPIVQNEPNFSIADCGLGTDLRQDTCTAAYRLGPAPASCTNKPNWLEPIVRNEPNLVGSNVQNEANCRAVGREPRRLLCKTKPICPGRPGMGTGGWGREGPRGRL